MEWSSSGLRAAHKSLFGIVRVIGRRILKISIKPDWAALFPVLRVVSIDPWAVTQVAEEQTLRRADHNSHMPFPDDQVTRLRMGHPAKTSGAAIKIARVRVAIVKACTLINGVHKVRAIVFANPVVPGVQRGSDYREAVIFTEYNRVPLITGSISGRRDFPITRPADASSRDE